MLRLYKEAQSLEEENKKKVAQLSKSKEEIMELNKSRMDDIKPVHRVPFMSKKFSTGKIKWKRCIELKLYTL
jgi:hypothetical protein